ncbi:MAG: PAS domain-containing protein, partial [Lachnospiraceae bacterium]|nr:PAS domain-containing protein [Lachnospiraceae bacterium]
WKDLIPEDEQQRLVDEFIENWKNGRNEYTREFDIITSDGEVIPAHDYIHILTDGDNHIIGAEEIIFDLAMETERNANLLFLENAINRSSNIVVVFSYEENVDDMKLIYISSNVERLDIPYAKLKSGERRVREFIHPDDLESVEKVLMQYSSKGYTYMSQEFRVIDGVGKEHYVRNENCIVVHPNGDKYLECVLTDISDAKAKEQHLLEQKRKLEKKMSYIESRDSLLSDMSVVDFVSKDELQTLTDAFSKVTQSYNAVLDLDGELITYPTGPDVNMGAFFDMFEKKEYKEQYFALNKELRRNHKPMKVELVTKEIKEVSSLNDPYLSEVREITPQVKDDNNEVVPVTLIGYPLFVEDKHLATWICCMFSDEEEDRLAYYVPSLWDICKAMAKYVYSSTIMERESEKVKLAEIQARDLLSRSRTIRDILRRCNETNDEDALEYVLRKIGDYLKLSRIDIMLYNKESEERSHWYEWKAFGVKGSHPEFIASNDYFNSQKQAFSEEGVLVYNASSLPIRFRRSLAQEHIRAMVAMPIYTLTMDQQYIVFQEMAYDRDWTEDEISFMHSTVSILQGFLQRSRSNVDVNTIRELHYDVLKLSRDYVYIKDLVDDKITFVNPSLEKLIGNAVGRTVTEVFKHSGIHSSSPVEGMSGATESKNCMMYNKLFGRPMRVREYDFTQSDNRNMRLVMISEENER